MTWAQFLSMGGFAFYVWSAYGFTAVVVILNIVQPLTHKRKVWQGLRRGLDDGEEERHEEAE